MQGSTNPPGEFLHVPERLQRLWVVAAPRNDVAPTAQRNGQSPIQPAVVLDLWLRPLGMIVLLVAVVDTINQRRPQCAPIDDTGRISVSGNIELQRNPRGVRWHTHTNLRQKVAGRLCRQQRAERGDDSGFENEEHRRILMRAGGADCIRYSATCRDFAATIPRGSGVRRHAGVPFA